MSVTPYIDIGSPTPNGTWTSSTNSTIPNPFDSSVDLAAGSHQYQYQAPTIGTCTPPPATLNYELSNLSVYDNDEESGAHLMDQVPVLSYFLPRHPSEGFVTNATICNGENAVGATVSTNKPPNWASIPTDGDLWYKFTNLTSNSTQYLFIHVVPSNDSESIQHAMIAVYHNNQLIGDAIANSPSDDPYVIITNPIPNDEYVVRITSKLGNAGKYYIGSSASN